MIPGSIDPTFMSWAGTVTSLSTAYDGLVGPARRGGSEGKQIVPNLALSLPVITAGGTRYAFQLRRGVRYSDGTLVKASDFRRAYERAFRRGAVRWDVPLVGHRRLQRRPQSCDLSRGIRTDDATGTIVFHLRRPEERFLRSLSVVAPIPRGTPDRDTGTRPVPSTGPYMIESYVPGRALTLVRNPYFHVWSRAARPDGFPDEIEFRLDGADAGVTAVERGRVDVATFPLDRTQDIQGARGLQSASRVAIPRTRRAGDGPPLPQHDASPVRRRPRAARGQLRRRPCRHLRVVRRGLSPSRRVSSVRPAPWASGATVPTPPPRARRASGRRPTSRVRAASSPLRGRGG